MSDTIKIIYKPNPSSEEIQSLYNGISEHAKLMKDQSPLECYGFFVYSDVGELLGGCTGATYYGCLYIDSLWVDPSLREQSVGTQLMESAEALAIERGCTFATVNTMDWEARGFYEKLGFSLEFERKGYKYDSILYFLRKPL